ncbi:APH(3') family aminoglycoside O-phosphotransferase [Rhodospirillum rubrum]|uniref:APH(3')-I family aminoglycoside O-phosphotransferase n=1 Tax=Rhodospirillum rubrum TaxID=1085 RepID=UPI001907598F|nr:APH(3')-I family aminoglycoside O-phosphotransferase [Rhodospirillum rubrum]MBK1664469.1 APH(3') family aminoglycoside O-phosphotransferase [Rhodospirillum rubrum]MBK1676175.1 APH(3') family aminoglycoside O-phosphotransferase [Rhodospirillum rubrum]
MKSQNREVPCAPIPLPASFLAAVAGYRWARDTVGESGGGVYRLHGKAGAADLFLKHGRDKVADDVTDEMVRLRWLAGQIPVPAVVQFLRTADEAWLLMSAISGRTVGQLLRATAGDGAVLDAVARFLRRLHAIPIDPCPFNSDHALRLALARCRIDAGLVDVDDFDEERQGWSAEDVWLALDKLLPLSPDRVVTHGDFSLDNLLIEKDEVVGCIDVGRLGIADRYQDIAILWNCLGEFGPDLQTKLLEAYGIGEPDRDKLLFHLLLDELF